MNLREASGTEMARLLEGRYAHGEKVILASDNLNTHTKGAFYAAFDPERARQLVRRIEFRHTPKHGRWRNIAENEWSSRTRQCVADRRLGNVEFLRTETAACSSDVNSTQRGVDWQMKIDDARTQLTSIYPKIRSGFKTRFGCRCVHQNAGFLADFPHSGECSSGF